jgi:membrane-bound lytic murein transglycosylase A
MSILAAGPVMAASKKVWKTVGYEPVSFADLPHWDADEHDKAYGAFLKSCQRLTEIWRSPDTTNKFIPDKRLLTLCTTAQMLPAKSSAADAKAFFERYFIPHRVMQPEPTGLFTGYYEPVVDGARQPSARFKAPLYRRPSDLVNLVDESQRGAKAHTLTHMRQTQKGREPYPTRAEIDGGALRGQNLELIYLEDQVEVFFMQIQGSGRIRLADGGMVRVTYDGKNGHPYTSLGSVLIKKGEIAADKMSLQALAGWLRANPERAREAMHANKSYVFFRELGQGEASSAHGVHNIPLTPGRSLAIDTSFHTIGMPVYAVAPEVKGFGAAGLRRLMVAQDVGSAIKGPERADIYYGSGAKAGKLAGTTKHPGNLFVLLPRSDEPAPRQQASNEEPSVKQ